MTIVFQSTPSTRRATWLDRFTRAVLGISIHALNEEGDKDAYILRILNVISIHALNEEGDAYHLSIAAVFGHISIHALNEEGDLILCRFMSK